MHWVYIIHSPSTYNYYIGEASDLKRRIEWHNNHQFKNASTAFASDWELFFSITVENISVARKIEAHVKRMKSKKYYHNLKTYPDIVKRLIEKYS